MLSENPYTNFEVRKDWPLKEAINLHFCHLQQESYQGDPRFCQIDILCVQAGLVNRKLGFTPWEWEEENIILSMDYFQLPFTILIREMNIGNLLVIFLSSNIIALSNRTLTSF